MKGLKERLDALRTLLHDPDFLEGRGLSNEVNIRIFCYDPKEEMTVVQFLKQLKSNDPLFGYNLIECNLYKTFLAVCTEQGIIDMIPEIEESSGADFLLKQLYAIKELLIKKILEPKLKTGNVLLLTGVGDVFPFMRVHTLLEALQPECPNIPILVMYPGEFNGYQLKLFNRLQPSDYYRAFRLIEGE